MPFDSRQTLKGRGNEAKPGAEAELLPCLFLVMECHRPAAGGARYVLGNDLDELVLGRGTERSHALEDDGEARRLVVRTDDLRMSSRHARVVRTDAGWELEDLGSTNGTHVDGRAVQRVSLEDGAVFELGSTIFLYRAAVPLMPKDARVLEDAALAPGVATLVPSYAMQISALLRVAKSTVPILLLGESGTGKEVLASVAHRVSGRAGAFVPVNCGALPDTLVESQLFGHMKGAFSGALRDEPGFVRASDGGTLFLDEIGDLPKTSQAALLRVLQEREVTPVGSTRPTKVDLRVVSATHRRIDALQAGGAFRNDLYARLAGFTLELLPLRERKEDTGILVGALLARIAPGMTLAVDLGRAIVQHDWPLNIRELEQCLTVAAALAHDGVLTLAHVPEPLRRAFEGRRTSTPPVSSTPTSTTPSASAPRASAGPAGAASATRTAESDEALRAQLLTSLARTRGNISEVAREMGRTRMQIHRWMKRWGIDPETFRK